MEKMFMCYLRLMARLHRAITPNKYNKYDKLLTRYALRRKIKSSNTLCIKHL